MLFLIALVTTYAYAIHFSSNFSAYHLWIHENLNDAVRHTFVLEGYDPRKMTLTAVSLSAVFTNAGRNTGEDWEYDRLHFFDDSGNWWGTMDGIPREFFAKADLTLNDAWMLQTLEETGHISLSMYGSGTFFIENITLTAKAKIESNPEPATMLLIGTGLIGLAGFWRWLKRSKEA